MLAQLSSRCWNLSVPCCDEEHHITSTSSSQLGKRDNQPPLALSTCIEHEDVLLTRDHRSRSTSYLANLTLITQGSCTAAAGAERCQHTASSRTPKLFKLASCDLGSESAVVSCGAWTTSELFNSMHTPNVHTPCRPLATPPQRVTGLQRTKTLPHHSLQCQHDKAWLVPVHITHSSLNLWLHMLPQTLTGLVATAHIRPIMNHSHSPLPLSLVQMYGP